MIYFTIESIDTIRTSFRLIKCQKDAKSQPFEAHWALLCSRWRTFTALYGAGHGNEPNSHDHIV